LPAICAFANDLPGHGKPGVVFVGVRDDGSPANLRVTDELLLSLGQLRDDGKILPIPSLTVSKRVIRGMELAAVTVLPSLSPPVRCDGRAWIRVGPRRATATPEEERRLTEKRRAADLPFDLHPLPSASLDERDLVLFEREYLHAAVAPDVLAQNARTTLDQMQALRFVSAEKVPTLLGMVVCGKAPRRYVPGAYVQFLRVNGQSLTDPIRDQKELDGPLSVQIRRLDEVLEAHNFVTAVITAGPLEQRQFDYPMAALQQLTRNALMHRSYEGTHAPVRITWYSDRVEIVNPGGPFGQVTRASFGQPNVTDYRNPHLAEAMKVLGFVQRFGVGIQIARQEMARNGNPPLEFEVGDSSILVRLRKRG
jgi:ATP-dependent DNA helicase RecG